MDANVPPVPDERSGLLGFLAQQRRVLRHAAHGLTEEQLRATPTVSALSIGGLLKHVAFTERGWLDRVAGRPDPRTNPEYDRQFELGDADTLESLLADLDAAAAETEATVAAVDDLGQAVPAPANHPAFAPDVAAWSVRWVLLHLIEDLARHAGQADIIRESIDGARAEELLAAAEGWPASSSVTPWRPRDRPWDSGLGAKHQPAPGVPLGTV
ncbi:DinB family protein [Actinophytocola oryzae]|uniref:DinB family protein n=1 Tax=Actinophytocola oryzae TaxID=502181 RepID=UPI001062C71A|nr:DinB family protein [Actinophytocola oryzae]